MEKLIQYSITSPLHYETSSKHPLFIDDFPIVTRAQQEAPWFERPQHDKQNKQIMV
jgi:hypothetical protein